MHRLTKQSPIEVQRSVIFSLISRELNVRFGRFRLGYAWAILEPVAYIAVLSGIRVLFGRNEMGGVSYPLFFASGIMPYLLFNHILISSMNAVEANRGIFNYQRVKPIDCVIARVVVEVVIYFASTFLIFSAFKFLGYSFTVADLIRYFLALFLLVLLGFGFGLILSIIGPLWQDSKKVVPILIRPLFFISGIFFVYADMPTAAQSILKWNPLLHAIESIRSALFSGYSDSGLTLLYLSFWVLVSMFIGLSVYRINRRHIVTSGNIR